MDIFGLHLIRPLWLLALLPIPALLAMLRRRYRQPLEWRGVLAEELQPHLLEPRGNIRAPLTLLVVGWVIAALAAAGPAWRQSPQPLQQNQGALVLILDLSRSMYANDVLPSRLERARNKLHDILRQRDEGLTALVAYSGDAFAITPLTDDVATISNLLDSLSPRLIPNSARGSNPLAAFEEAKSLLADVPAGTARLLLVTDGVRQREIGRLGAWLNKEELSISILGVGTRSGAPIPLPNGDFLRDAAGNLIVVGLDAAPLRRLAAASDGRYHALTLDDTDVDYLLGKPGAGGDTRASERELKIWHEEGVWLALALLPLALIGFRRGWLVALLALASSAPSQALEWRDLWSRRDQQGVAALAAGDAVGAAELLEDPHWRGLALYKDGRYTEAIEALPAEGEAILHYNRGNALALSGKLQAALNAYDAALDLNPAMADAGHNREIIRQLLEQAEKGPAQPGDGDPEQGDQQQAQSGQPSDQKNSEEKQSYNENSEESSEEDSEEDGQAAAEDEESQEASENQNAAADADNEASETDSNEERDLSALLREGEADPESERQQALDTFLRQVPDDHPAQLLRKKLHYQHRQRQRQQRSRVDRDDPGL